MKKFKQFVKEDLNLALVEPDSEIAAQAQKLGLQYVGFGRYEDPKIGQVTHMNQNGVLTPYVNAIRSNTYKKDSINDIESFSVGMDPERLETHNILTTSYSSDLFSNEELDAMKTFTDDPQSVNATLLSFPPDADLSKIQPDFDGDSSYATIMNMTSAIQKLPIPTDVIAYASLGSDIDSSSIAEGSVLKFKTFRSTSLNMSMILNTQQPVPGETRKDVYVLQINVKQGTKALYVDNFSVAPDENELILPVGSTVRILNGPHKITGSSETYNINNYSVFYFECETI